MFDPPSNSLGISFLAMTPCTYNIPHLYLIWWFLCQQRNMKRNGSRSCVTRKTRFGSRERDWLKGDAQRGCVCLYGGTVDPQPPASGPQATSNPQADLQLVLCSTSTTVEELCAQRDGKGLYVQLHGDLVRWVYCSLPVRWDSCLKTKWHL